MYLNPAIFNNTNYRLALIFAYSLFTTMIAIPYIIKKCKDYGYIVKDMHKWGYPMVPVLGGTAILAGVVISLALSQILLPDKSQLGNLFVFYFVVLVYGMYGLIDDIFHFKVRYSKIIVCLILSLPIGSLLTASILNLKFFSIELGIVYALLFAPIYIMVVGNLINIHAGFNGLGPGTTLIALIAAGIKSYMTYGTTYLIYLMPILGALLVFFWYNKYPAKIFDGNIGSFLMGSALGAFLIINNLELFGVFILIPNIITFVLDFWVLGVKGVKDIEFPKPRKDGIIVIDKTMRYKSFKNVICTWFKVTEKQATNIILLITTILCVIGVVWI